MIPDWAAKPTSVPYANFGNPQSLNLYSYVQNNPTTVGDPDGHDTQDTVDPQAAQEAGQVFAGAVKGLWNMVAGTWNTGAELLNAQGQSSGQPYIQVPTLPTASYDNTTQAISGAAAQLGTVVYSAVEGATAGSGTETVQRAMSEGELNATQDTGLVRGGREGTHYVSDAVNNDAGRAQQRLALPQKPAVKATMEVPKGKFSAPKKVLPANKMPGGGTERTATGKIPVKIKKVKNY
jgi:hypothetical protein